MLYIESWKRGKKGVYQVILAGLLLLTACNDASINRERPQDIKAFQTLKVKEYALNSPSVRESLEHLISADKDSSQADFFLRRYYREKNPLVWVGKFGVSSQADVLVEFLKTAVNDIGFTERSFHVRELENDISTFRTLDFTPQRHASDIAAHVEYYLMKAYLRFVMGQRYGFVNPSQLLNHLSPSATDSLGNPTGFQSLFDIKMEHPARDFAQQAALHVSNGKMEQFLRDVMPTDTLYLRLKAMLGGTTGAARTKLLVNMERRRWRVSEMPRDKYVLVNIAAYHLWAVSPDTVIDMRIGCGAQKTKTPLLTSTITHMEVNPEWVIPMSIVKTDVARHGGDSSYFSRHNYYIAERSTGTILLPQYVTPAMLLSGKLKVAQKGGRGNALGRIIFRFANKYSVFLHHTSSPGFFESANRSVSHGCVRVQQPFELAKFLLPDADEWRLDKLRLAMGLQPETTKGMEYLDSHEPEDLQKLIKWVKVEPCVPLFITYYTIYPHPVTGQLAYYPDVYGYDKCIEKAIKPFML